MAKSDYVCISGGSGLLGKALTVNLIAKGYRPIILSRSQLQATADRTVLVTDYSLNSLREGLKPYWGHIEAFVHLAGDRSPKRDERQICAAVEQMRILTRFGNEGCFARLLLASSISVYGNPTEPIPWSEDVVPRPISGYAEEKLALEQAGRETAESVTFAALRFTHLFGPLERNNYMINLFMRLAYNHKPIQVNLPAPAKREFLYTGDCAEVIVRAITAPLADDVYNIGSGEALTNAEVAETINDTFSNPHDVVYHDTDKAPILRSSCLDSGRALKAFGDYRSGTFADHMREIYTIMKSSGKIFPDRY